MNTRLTAVLLVLLLAAAAPCLSQTPLGTGFTYQGQLKQNGQPYNGSADMVFELYDDPTAGNLLGAQMLNGVAVSAGLFTVQLNGAGEFGASGFIGEQRWLEISINGTPLSPRQELTAGPYALFSKDSGQLAGQFAGFYLDAGNINAGMLAPAYGGTGLDTSAAESGSLLYTSGIGAWSLLAPGTDSQVLTSAGGVPTWGNPSGFALPYNGSASVAVPDAAFKVTNTDTGYALWGQSDSTYGRAVFGQTTAATGYTYGVWGVTASVNGNGVVGQATAATGSTYGVVGESMSPDGVGIYGFNNTATTGNTYGGRFESASTSGNGVGGFNSATTGFTNGVYGQSSSTSGSGVSGFNFTATGFTNGVYGQSGSTDGHGVFGWATASSGFTTGVWGLTESTSGDIATAPRSS